jgi:hypothetical protein
MIDDKGNIKDKDYIEFKYFLSDIHIDKDLRFSWAPKRLLDTL